MEQRRLLYKSKLSALSPTNQRKVANDRRATKRSELYSSTRNISLSPAPKHNFPNEDKENLKTENVAIPTTSAPKINEKESRQKAYVMKFLAWKLEKAKKEQLEKEKFKQAPFVVPTGRAVVSESNITKKSSFAPKDHVFDPVLNLKNFTVDVVGKNTVRCINEEGKQGIYHLVGTPKKKMNPEPKASSVTVTTRSVVPRTMVSSKSTIKPVQTKPLVAPSSAKVPSKNLVSTNGKLPSVDSQKPPSKCSTSSAVKASATVSNVIPPVRSKTILRSATFPTSEKAKMLPPAQPFRTKTPIRTPNLPSLPTSARPLSNVQKSKMPPPAHPAPKIHRKPHSSLATTASSSSKPQNSNSGVSGIKRPTFKASKKASTSIGRAATAVGLKARSKISAAPSNLKMKDKSLLLQCMQEHTNPVEPIPETPTDSNPDQAYLNFVTSTKRKSSASKDLRADLLFADLGNTISPVEDGCSASGETKPNETKDKFNFVRYSVVETDKVDPAKPEDAEIMKTPEKTAAAPTTYLSPYVSVSRGKVNAKAEKEKRNSVYMPPDDSSKSPETTAAVRRTLATVRYYRKQLMDEIARLDVQCHDWEKYKEENNQLIEDGGIDMINVTIGQTKLLTTKKLKQFGGLIDRCEDAVLGKISAFSGSGEGARPILPEDLEGFWSMVGLQIENVDKRFANLERWKTNAWNDPDEVSTTSKIISSLANSKKTKKRKPVVNAKPNGGLRKMLQAAHAAYLNKKALGGVDEDVILTPSKTRQVLIMNRRSFSAAATVITVNKSQRKPSPQCQATGQTDLDETPKHPPHMNGRRKSVNLLKSTLLSELEKKSPAGECVSPVRQPMMSRKSILKTPGSVSRPKGSVVFNSSPQLKFTIEDAVDTPRVDQYQTEDDMRTYKLRNRRIVLRDSAEFVIPK